ncbi:tRNA-intron lyase [Malassezia brasiliensis]|uniref:tRNA-splicing endonuclease subunit Sen2 n=1 Tax=Malassezia brasiliensis TaxID=1821822 RepID=A0AAF0DRC1_9BASI|nr:tRNA-intron lyase [Malassezia brasiliensis]
MSGSAPAMPEATPLPNVKGAGKKATQAKRQLYANPLPIGHSPALRPARESQSWWDWFNACTKWFCDRSQEPPIYKAWYDDMTKSVWMYDTGDALELWTRGFFGKGNLSRSEPTWKARKEAEYTARERGEMTAEQMTQKRREERKLLKIERARAAVKAGIQLPDGITALGGTPDDDTVPDSDSQGAARTQLWRGDEDLPEVQAGVARVKGLKHFSADLAQKDTGSGTQFAPSNPVDDRLDVEGVEHFQLTLVEAFFLAGMLGCLDIYDGEDREVWSRPDNPFLLSYIIYHHFRSLGWVVKNGSKFCVDYLLYKRGPVFSHAEFAVLVVPEYADEADATHSPFVVHHNQGDKSWVWFSMVNRVNSQVQKTLILAHVLVPSRIDCAGIDLARPNDLIVALQRGLFRVKEVGIRRWVPARMKP